MTGECVATSAANKLSIIDNDAYTEIMFCKLLRLPIKYIGVYTINKWISNSIIVLSIQRANQSERINSPVYNVTMWQWRFVAE